MKLALPAGAVSPSGSSSNGTNAATGAAGGSYTVKAGDLPSKIAARNGVTPGKLLTANNMTATSLITPGMTLALPEARARRNRRARISRQPGRASTRCSTCLRPASKPYQFCGVGTDARDCSGLTRRLRPDRDQPRAPERGAGHAGHGGGVLERADPPRRSRVHGDPQRRDHPCRHRPDGDTWIQARRPGDAVKVGPMPAKTSIVAVRRFVTSG